MTKEEFVVKLGNNGYSATLEYAAPSEGELHDAWLADRAEKLGQFKADLLEAHALTGSPKGELLFKIAQDKVTTGDLKEIAAQFATYQDLL